MKHKSVAFLFGLCLILLSGAARADVVGLVVDAARLKLENYLVDNPVVWYAGSICSNGQLTLPETATAGDKNRLWATVLAAKLSSGQVFFYYDNSSAPSRCVIVSFGPG